MSIDLKHAYDVVDALRTLGMVDRDEQARIMELLGSDFPFSGVLAHADSLHIHVKVDDTEQLPLGELERAEYRVDHQKPGFIKFVHDTGIHLICSSIPVSEEELTEGAFEPRARPWIDHLGIDLRTATDSHEGVFAEVPRIAEQEAWCMIEQGGQGRAVRCCHVQVARKHWVFPSDDAPKPHLPLEFAYGPLQINQDGASGCDLRPANPRFSRSMSKGSPTKSCSGGD